ncbi:MAG: 30S ribosomal protein S17 [Planctomycetes bacterium RBG_13_44_8b]|nr:MAG: 30S ribosomal protein S17 [Planctomycetes bacterium RBG_13_44_8b]
MEAKERKKERKIICGTVVSRSGDKSIRVVLNYRIRHPVYGKYINRRTKLGVHDDKNQAKVGDVVEITECRPMSKTKSWRLLRIVQEANKDLL